MHSDSTLIGRAATGVASGAPTHGASPTPLATAEVDRSDTAARVAAVIARRARVVGRDADGGVTLD